MRFLVQNKPAATFKGHCLAIGVFKNQAVSRELHLPVALTQAISDAIQSKEFEAEAGQLYRIPSHAHASFRHLLLAGLGETQKATAEIFRKATASAVNACKSMGFSSVGIAIHETACPVVFKERVQAVCEGALLASYAPPDYRTVRTEKEKRQKIDSIELVCSTNFSQAQAVAKETQLVCENVFLARDWVNFSSSSKTPTAIARLIASEAKSIGVKCTVYDKKQIAHLKMGGVLAVNAGSVQPPVFVKLEYKPSRYKKTLAVVGKGITFDSGGLNIKPWEGMLTMKQDMAGAATAIAATFAIAQLRLPVRVLCFCPFTENMPGNNAYKNGDIITTFNGKTIEMIHSDAEGRIVLADALAFAESHKPDFLIDLATLTGAQDVALGRYFIGAMGNNPTLLKRVLDAGNQTMERCWELPLIEEWNELVKSDVADVRNISKNKGEAGTLIGGAFLKQFVQKTPWVHLDIASTAFFLEGDFSRSYLSKGASGVGVRLLVETIKNLG